MEPGDEEEPQPSSNRLANRISQAAEQGQKVFTDIGRTIGRTAASASELLSDAELRRKGRILLVHEASRGIREIQQKVGNAAGNLGRSLQQGAGTIQRGIASGPRQLQGALERVRQRVNEAHLAHRVEIHRSLAVDVQIAEKLYEDAPQEIRSRLWVVLTLDPTFKPVSLQRQPTDAQSVDQADLRQGTDTIMEEESVPKEEEDGWELLESPFRGHKDEASGSGTVVESAIVFETLLEAMSEVEWPLSEQISEDSNYGILIQITIGQDEIDEIIGRDIHRTFPELPHFDFPEKRAALFNILKAYSLHDLEVAYCQGMGFVAGILLLYLPEEWAFRMLCLLMNEQQVNLRRLYVPGLEPLKKELWKLEWLLEKHLPILARHLSEHCVGAVLYASQWFLTCFACPFADFFCARVLDFLLLEKSILPLLRTAFAVLAQLGEDLLQRDNFEDILLHIKLHPLSWDVRTVRQVLSASLSSPITNEEAQSAEQEYKRAHEESESVRTERDTELDIAVPCDGVGQDEAVRRVGSTAEDLELFFSMDLLLDVDVPEEDPIVGDKLKTE